jgi:hypothetical protein
MPLPPATEQRNKQRKLKPRNRRRRQHDNRDDQRPAENLRAESHRRKRTQVRREHGEPITQRKRHGETQGLERTRPGKRGNGAARAMARDRVECATETDAKQRDREDQPKVNVEPPSSGLSIRYQTSSMSKKAKATIAEAASTKPAEWLRSNQRFIF